MGEEGRPHKAEVVDLRRWREERDRKRRAGPPSSTPVPGRAATPANPPESGLSHLLRPLPVFLGISILVLVTGIGADFWEPALFWMVGILHVGLHELGHLLAVRQVGYTPRRLVVGPLTVRWDDGRRSLAATPERRWLLGGHVWFDAPHPTRARDLAVLLAGPLANLLTVGAVLILRRFVQPNPLFDLYVRANLFCAALVLLANLLPLPRTQEGFATDGRQILEILRGRRIA